MFTVHMLTVSCSIPCAGRASTHHTPPGHTHYPGHTHPHPTKDMGPEIPTHPCEQTNTWENITFPQLRLQAVIKSETSTSGDSPQNRLSSYTIKSKKCTVGSQSEGNCKRQPVKIKLRLKSWTQSVRWIFAESLMEKVNMQIWISKCHWDDLFKFGCDVSSWEVNTSHIEIFLCIGQIPISYLSKTASWCPISTQRMAHFFWIRNTTPIYGQSVSG